MDLELFVLYLTYGTGAGAGSGIKAIKQIPRQMDHKYL